MQTVQQLWEAHFYQKKGCSVLLTQIDRLQAKVDN